MPHDPHADPASGTDAPEDQAARNAATSPPPRRRWLKRLLFAGLLPPVLAVAAVLYARSEDALQRFYIPAAARLGNAEIEANGFQHRFPLSLGLKHLQVRHRPTGATLKIEQLETTWDLPSLLNASTPRLELLKAASFSFTLPLELDEEDRPRAETVPGVRQTPWIPLRIERAEIDIIDVEITDIDQAWFSARMASLTLRDLNPGASAHLATSLDVRFTPPASGRVFVAGGELDAALRQPEEGRALAWEIDWPVEVRESGQPAPEGEPLEFSAIQRLEGSLSPASESELSLQATASRRNEPAGAVSAQLRIGEPVQDRRRPVLLEATADQLQPALINPILAALGPESLSTGSVDGRLHLELGAGEMEIVSELRGDDLRLAANRDHRETPPISIELLQEGLFQNEQRKLRIERAALSVREGGAQRVEARLTAPFEFLLQDSATTETPETSLASPESTDPDQTGSPARLELSINRIEIDRLKPWTAVWGSEALSAASGGTVSANLTAQLASSARSVSVQGQVQVRDLLWSTDEASSTLGPLDIDSDFETQSPDLSRFTVPRFASTLEISGQDFATLDGEGAFNRKDGSLSGRFTAALPDLPLMLEETGLIAGNAPVALETGNLELELSANRASRNERLRLEGGLQLGATTLAVEGNRLVRTAKADFSGHVPPRESRIEAILLKINVSDESGAEAGKVNVEGYWPTRFDEAEATAPGTAASPPALPPSPVSGKLGIRARDFDLKPWLELFGLRLEDGEGPAWPASADLTLTVDPAGEIFTLEGEERLGPVASETQTTAETAPPNPQP